VKYLFKVQDLSCGHCKMHIDQAFKDWGKASSWTVDLKTKLVEVESEEPAAIVSRIIEDEGYSPVQA